MVISIISAIGKNRVIGIKNGLPWHLPADFAHFRKKTLGRPIIMGEKTFESLLGKPLPDRTNIVLTDDKNFKAQGVIVARGVEEALLEAEKYGEEVMICGGASIYRQFLPKAQRMYLTLVDASPDGDTYFPEFSMDEWLEVAREDHNKDEKNNYNYSFLTLEHKKN